jgi:dephospho-CoA kinase
MRPCPIRDCLRVGVTGGIGGGKSTVCRLFGQLGRTVLSADNIAHELTQHNESVKAGIRRVFGPDMYAVDGSLDRRKLAAVVFRDESLRKKLNAIIHPLVFQSLENRILDLSPGARTPYVLIEAALIFETGMNERLDYVIVVDAPEEKRITRVIARDGISRREVMQRIRSQFTVGQRRMKADFIIDNDGAEADLFSRVRFLDSLFSLMISPREGKALV